jgi:microcystin-dependent protein
MADPYLSEIRITSFPFPPKGWALCNGQLMSISQNQALFSLLGTTYGGNGQTTFALPNLQGRVPIHFGTSGGATHTQGETQGEQNHTLVVGELPAHIHQQVGTSAAGSFAPPSGRLLAASDTAKPYGPPDASATTLQPNTLANAGQGQPHPNMQPYLTLSFCIALVGIFPSRN